MAMRAALPWAILFWMGLPGRADDSDAAAALLDSFQAKRALARPLPGLTLANAPNVRNLLVDKLARELGPPVGYKVGLTNAAIRQRLAINDPVHGVLLDRMLLRATPGKTMDLPSAFAALPRAEGDLLVRVGSNAIERATTDLEILACLDAVIPFIELPDGLFAPQFKPNAAHLVAANVGARLGVMGSPIALEPNEHWRQRLASFRFEAFDESGKAIGGGVGADLMGHPLNVVRWLRDNLARDGKRLKRGDLLSLGSLTPPLPIRPGQQLEGVYLGLDVAPIRMSIRFVER